MWKRKGIQLAVRPAFDIQLKSTCVIRTEVSYIQDNGIFKLFLQKNKYDCGNWRILIATWCAARGEYGVLEQLPFYVQIFKISFWNSATFGVLFGSIHDLHSASSSIWNTIGPKVSHPKIFSRIKLYANTKLHHSVQKTISLHCDTFIRRGRYNFEQFL